MLLTILLFLALLSILVLAHEWGHYAAAKRAGMIVEEFGIGFPPKLFSWQGKGGTEWSINLIPLGGFVRIQGENGEKRFEPGSFATKSYGRRFLVLIGGVFMNIVVAVFLFTVGFMFGLPAIVEDGTDPLAIVSDRAINIVEVLPESPAEQAGIKPGDKLLTIDGATYTSGEEARAALVPKVAGEPVEVTVEQAGEDKTVKLMPTYLDELNKDGVGIALVETGNVRYPWYYAPVQALVTTFGMLLQIIMALGTLIVGLFKNQSEVVAQLSGPVGIAVLTGEVAQLGFAHLVQFAAMISVNLAVLNALPIPALDGGRILFLLIEAIRRKPLNQKVEQIVHTAGFALLMLLVLFVTYRDIVKLF